MQNATLVPSEALAGLQLDGGWIVGQKVTKHPAGTGGNFSVCYEVSRNGKPAFLKALNLTRALQAPNMVREMQALTEAFNFEVDLLGKTAKMDRIVRALDHGEADVPGSVVGKVPYLIFEFADRGDIRSHMATLGDLDTAWKLRAMHQIAVAVLQLHGARIAHQDLKPSNVLIFDEGSKLADLGCASYFGTTGPRDGFDFAGDPGYAPPELLYGHLLPDWNKRRFGADLWMLGSMAVFLFSQLTVAALLFKHLDRRFYPSAGVAYEDVLPYLDDALALGIAEFVDSLPNHPGLRSDLGRIVSELCNPDPERRAPHKSGHPAAERYVSEFARLAKQAELRLFG